MAKFEIEVGGKRYEVEAPDQQAAMNAVRQMAAPPENPVSSTLPGPLGGFQDFSRAFQTGATQGMTLGFADEVGAGMFALPEAIGQAFQGQGFDLGRGYNTALERVRGIDEATAELNPIANLAGNITGNAILAGSVPTMTRGAAPTIGSMAGRGAIDGLLYGSLAGFGTGEQLDERVQQALTGGAVGAGLGAAAGGVAGALANRSVAANTPEATELFDEAGALYDAARESKVVFQQPSVRQTADDIAAKVISEGLDPDLHPRATVALRRLQEAANGNLTAQDAMTLRRVIAAAGGDLTNPDQSRLAGMMTRAFDDFVSASIPETVAANALYQTAKKTELIENTIQRARDMSGANYTASGFENALRQQFKSLLTSRSALRGFTDAEVAAIRKVAEGGPIENVLRWVGKFSAGSPFSAGVTVGGPAAIIGSATDPMTGLAVGGTLLGAGTLSRNAATASTLNNANLARALIASGGNIPPITGVSSGLIPAGAAVGGFGGSAGNDLVSRALIGN